ncbi:hypothetical protein O1611_g8888 [Lasiodiplodia mahajangana]|uniref:Uncharacterized protein n=1 Tax=Lasiodiplodia mahajangana TaxID=1108764 RepID=A0ACC2JBT3_9PEZI|nr:hypothetical protein O1611_g8888 [Lasiodiplodia mahajangana]
MAHSPPPDPLSSGHRRPFVPTAAEFTPKVIEARDGILKLSFITQTVPVVHRYAGIVAICTVPEDKADMSNLGWHVADFLAFRTLLCGDNPPKAQTWMSMCDIPALVEANPQAYTHGKDRRLVGSAVRLQHHQGHSESFEREDDIQVESSAEAFKEKFVSAVKEKLKIVESHKYPLLLIVCGPTSLEQDIYFGALDTEHRYTMKDLHHDLGDGINNTEAIVITPSLFSAGWQINASFGCLDLTAARVSRTEFLARQFGGIFAQDLVKSFLGWNCPVIDETKVNQSIKRERFPGPVVPSDGIKTLISQLKIKIQSYLVGGLSNFHTDHSFSFNKSKDEWENLIVRHGKLANPVDYPALDFYERKWKKLPCAQSLDPVDEGFPFLGNVFGGTRKSQLSHIKFLIEESYLAWPDYWALSFGQETRKDFERFMMNTENLDDLNCHEIFNVLEHRARMSILADTIVQYFDLPIPHNQRCRDWDHLKWQQELSENARVSLIKHFGNMLQCVPGPNVPPGINPNYLNRLQMRLESGSRYVRAALGIQYLTTGASGKTAISRIEAFLQKVKVRQAELVASNPEVYQMCCSWLNAINIPVRGLDNLGSVLKECQNAMEPADAIYIPDRDDEYDIYRGDGVDLSEAAVIVRSTPAEQRDAPTVELSGNAVTQGGREVAPTDPVILATQLKQDEMARLHKLMFDLAVKEAQLIAALSATNIREERQRLTTELLDILQKSKDLSLGAEDGQKDDVFQNGASKPVDNDSIANHLFVEAKDDDCHYGGMMQAKTSQNTTSNGLLQLPSQQSDQQLGFESQQSAGRKTPPHLRGIGGGRRN